MAKYSDQEIAAFKQQHRKVGRLAFDEGDVIVRVPTSVELSRYRQGVAKEDRPVFEYIDELGKFCIVAPDETALADLALLLPGIYSRAGGVALELAGYEEKVKVEKLLSSGKKRDGTSTQRATC